MKSIMKVLITGANGLLGANTVRSLEEHGFEVKALVRKNADIRSLHNTSCEIVRADISLFEDIYSGLNDCDAVIHCASSTDVRAFPYSFFVDANVKPTRNIVNASLRQNNKRLVYVSTANAFDPGSKDQPGTEKSPFTLDRYGSGYINSKHEAQTLVLDAAAKQNANAIVINPTFMIGPYDQKPSSGEIIIRGLKPIQLRPRGGKNFVHVRDVAETICKALTSATVGESYIVGGQNLSYEEFYDLLNSITGKHPLIKCDVSRRTLTFAGSLVESFKWLSDTPPKLTVSNAKLLSSDNYYSNAKAVKEFQVKPTPIKKAIMEAVEWFNKYGYIRL